MYDDWRAYHNGLGYLNFIVCDLDDASTLTPENLCYALCRFINEVKKLDRSDIPPCTLKDIILGVQFYLEMQGYSLHLIDDDVFRSVHFTLDNVVTRSSFPADLKMASI